MKTETYISCKQPMYSFFNLQPTQKNILYGSVLKLSTVLRYLPAYFEFEDDESKEDDVKKDGKLSPKNQKRQKVINKEEQFAKLLKPLNIQDCDFESFPDPDLKEKKPNTKLKTSADNQKFYKKLDGEYFIDNAAIKFQLRNLNIIDVSDIDIVLVSTFNDLYGLPFITRLATQFKGKIFMTQPLAQIGQHLVNELVTLNQKRNMTKDFMQSSSYFKMDKMHEVFARMGIEEWQDLYTHEDVEVCFSQHLKVLSYNETFVVDNLLKLVPLSSGMHIGSCNWLLEIGQQRIGIMGNSSEEGDFRHPLYFNSEGLRNLDMLLIGSIARQSSYVASYNAQIKQFFDKLQNCLSSSLNAKVLLPCNSQFILEIIDILIHKISDRVRIIFISESASQIIQYANINVEYLNLMLQKKIYNAENPFSFEKLFKDDRMLVFNNIQQYLEYKKERFSGMSGMGTFDEFSQELIITTSPNFRFGESVYWLHNLNKHQVSQSFVILTDPQYTENELLMKPFQSINNVKVLHSPIDPNLTLLQINQLINTLNPKIVICPKDFVKSFGSDQFQERSLITIKEGSQTVLETLIAGQSLTFTEQEIGKLKYMGLCPTQLANQIKQNSKGQVKLSRAQGIEISFKDNKYNVLNINKGKKKDDVKQHLYFKLLDIKQKVTDKQQNQSEQQVSGMIQVNKNIPFDKSLNQLRVTLAQHGLKNDASEDKHQAIIKLEEHQCSIILMYQEKRIEVQCSENLIVMKKVSEVIRKVLKLI